MAERAAFTLPEGFTTEVRAYPGFDYRDEPDDKRGAGSLTLWFILRGPGGAIAWELLTGIMARPIEDPGWSIYAGHPPHRGTRPGLDWTGGRPHHPTAGPVSLHWPTPDKDWWAGPNPCDVLPGEQCYFGKIVEHPCPTLELADAIEAEVQP